MRPFARFGLWCPLLFAVGCGGRVTPEFVERDQFRGEKIDLVAKHRQQINEHLTRYFGTPSNPRLMLPANSTAEDNPAAGEQSTVEFRLVDQVAPAQLLLGRQVYAQRCEGCHGVSGDGNGPASSYLDPKPRDYRLGLFKFISTVRGTKPLRSDLLRIVRLGAKGTSMPAFRFLPDDEAQAVVDYVILLSSRGELELQLLIEASDALDEEDNVEAELAAEFANGIAESWRTASTQLVAPQTHMPESTEETITQGQAAFLSKGCAKCHGADGRGKTQDNVGKDDWGNTVFAADLTSGMLRGGRRPIDLYRRIDAGINGTPMPAFHTALESEPETIWHLVHFIQAVAGGRPFPPTSETPALTTGDMPGEADSSTEPAVDEPPLDAPPAAEPNQDSPRAEEPSDANSPNESPSKEPRVPPPAEASPTSPNPAAAGVPAEPGVPNDE